MIKKTIILLIIIAGISGCVEQQKNGEPGLVPAIEYTGRLNYEPAQTEQPIEMMITFKMLSDFCTGKNYTIATQFKFENNGMQRVGYNIYGGDGGVSSSDTTLHRVCRRTNKITEDFSKNEVTSWLISTGTVSTGEIEGLQNIPDAIYNTFCEQSGRKLNSVSNVSITCYREQKEEIEVSGQIIAKWILQQQLKGN